MARVMTRRSAKVRAAAANPLRSRRHERDHRLEAVHDIFHIMKQLVLQACIVSAFGQGLGFSASRCCAVSVRNRSHPKEGNNGPFLQQGPLSPGAIGRFLVPDPLPERLLYAEPLAGGMRVRFGGAWTSPTAKTSSCFHEPAATQWPTSRRAT